MNRKKIVSLCKRFTEENGFEIEEQMLENIYIKLRGHEIISAKDLNLDLKDASIIIALIDSDEDFGKVSQKLMEMDEARKVQVKHGRSTMKELEQLDDLIMLIMVSTLDYKNRIEKTLRKSRYLRNIIPEVSLIGTDSLDASYTIRIESRIQSLCNKITVPKSEKKSEEVTGYVYSAFLADILNIYNEMGDELFKKNVRLKVEKDTIGLRKDIKETLRTNPDQFWFCNNGITIVTNAAIDMTNADYIRLTMDKDKSFSVVNGAQTVSAAHEFIYCDGEDKGVINNAKEAKVLLRVVSVEEIDSPEKNEYEPKESMSEKVSISLNRQKPIEAEDLAYFSQFVKCVNDLYADAFTDKEVVDNRFFGIARRGENWSTTEHPIPLIARAILASGMWEGEKRNYYPWKAINTYNAEVLRIDDKYELRRKDLFKKECAEDKNIFLENYQCVNLAIFLYKRYLDVKMKVRCDGLDETKIKTVKESGGWFFVTFFFEYLLKIEKSDRLQPDCIDSFDEYMSDDFMERAVALFFSVMNSNKYIGEVRSLRKEETYKEIESLVKDNTEYRALRNLAKKILITFINKRSYKYKNYDVTLVVQKDKYILKKGSVINIEISDSCPYPIKEKREEVKDIIDDNGKLKESIEFDDSFDAAKFIEGRRLGKRKDDDWKILEK